MYSSVLSYQLGLQGIFVSIPSMSTGFESGEKKKKLIQAPIRRQLSTCKKKKLLNSSKITTDKIIIII